MDIKLFVFDMAGTTVQDDDFVAMAFVNAFEKNGYRVTLADTHPFMGVKKIIAIKQMLSQLGVPADDAMADAIHQEFIDNMVKFYNESDSVKPFDDTEKVFTYYKNKGALIALNTGFPKIIATAIVQRLGWLQRGLIDDYIASDEVQDGRPSAMMIQELMRRHHIGNAFNVAKIGDTTVDIREGRNAGCGMVVSVTTGSGTREELSALQPDYIIEQLSGLMNIV